VNSTSGSASIIVMVRCDAAIRVISNSKVIYTPT
jgi:hypothetical protein